MYKASSFWSNQFLFWVLRVCNLIIKPWVGQLILLHMHFCCHSGKPAPTLEYKPTLCSSQNCRKVDSGSSSLTCNIFCGQTSICFMKVVIQRQWHGDTARQATHKALIVFPCAKPCASRHCGPRGFLLCVGRRHLSVTVSQSQDYGVTAEQGDGAALTLLLSKWHQHTGAIEERGKGCCRQGTKYESKCSVYCKT